MSKEHSLCRYNLLAIGTKGIFLSEKNSTLFAFSGLFCNHHRELPDNRFFLQLPSCIMSFLTAPMVANAGAW